MTSIALPIVGPGTQPAEADAELDILQLPSGMDTYAQPILPEPEEVSELRQAKQVLHDLHKLLQHYGTDRQAEPLRVIGLPATDRMLIDQVLGEGEVSIVCGDNQSLKIQESVLAGVWRVRQFDAAGALLEDAIEVGSVPAVLVEQSFTHATQRVEAGEAIPAGVYNAPPLLAEINDHISTYEAGKPAHVINLTLLPQSEQDLTYLAERLGAGKVTILSRGYGNCRISSTATQSVWWVQYFNSQDKNILNTLEIVDVPSVACAAPEDISDSAERLAEILDLYQ